jgi:ATP-binding cassette subfamily F protein 3
MFSLHQINKVFGNETILANVSFSINQGERVGLIGPNGCGKTTLLRIIAGLERPDSGVITKADPKLIFGYLPQGIEYSDDMTFGETLSRHFYLSDEANLRLEQLALAIELHPTDEIYQKEYDEVLRQIQERPSIHPRALLDALGLSDIPDDHSIANLSGGQKTRLGLADMIMKNPQLLLLDEPTNHLDIKMLEWLENWINNFHGAALIVSHDRIFLDRTVQRIFELDAYSHSIREYQGNYSDYLKQSINEREKQIQAYCDQEYEIRRMKQDIANTKQHAKRVELTTTSRQPGIRRIAKKVAKKAKSREKKLERYLESEARIKKPEQSWQMKLVFDRPSHLSKKVLVFDTVSIGYQGFPPLIQDLNFTISHGERIVLTGPNGGGKTTLLKTIAGKLEPLAGKVHLGTSVQLGYMAQEQETLPADQNSLQLIQQIAPFSETEVRSFLHYFLFSGDESLRSVSNLSYGERSRLSLAVLVAQGSNLLLLDEPINHLDIPSRERFEQSLAVFDGTVLAVIHDRYFIERFATQVWFLENGQINRLAPDEINKKRLS